MSELVRLHCTTEQFMFFFENQFSHFLLHESWFNSKKTGLFWRLKSWGGGGLDSGPPGPPPFYLELYTYMLVWLKCLYLLQLWYISWYNCHWSSMFFLASNFWGFFFIVLYRFMLVLPNCLCFNFELWYVHDTLYIDH